MSNEITLKCDKEYYYKHCTVKIKLIDLLQSDQRKTIKLEKLFSIKFCFYFTEFRDIAVKPQTLDNEILSVLYLHLKVQVDQGEIERVLISYETEGDSC